MKSKKKLKNILKIKKTKHVDQKVAVKEQQSDPQLLLHYKKTDQTHFCLGVRAYDLFDKRRYALAFVGNFGRKYELETFYKSAGKETVWHIQFIPRQIMPQIPAIW